MKLKLIALIGGAGLLAAGAAGAQLLRTGYDEPAHEVLLAAGEFEVRRYERRIVAETRVTATDWRRGTGPGFGRLADYIFGENRVEDGGSEKIAMTTPVETSKVDAGEVVVVFTMPAAYTMDELPRPTDDRITLREVGPATVATLRFSGVARNQPIPKLELDLREKLREYGWVATGPVKVAQYDPPWVIGPLRRNELMVDVERADRQ